MRTTNKARNSGYRSGSEERTAKELQRAGVAYKYEPTQDAIQYTLPERQAKYLQDFVLSNGVVIEVKGFFSPADRKKHMLIKKQHPKLDIRFLFDNARRKISKTSKTRYCDWCEKNGFKWAEKRVPRSWVEAS